MASSNLAQLWVQAAVRSTGGAQTAGSGPHRGFQSLEVKTRRRLVPFLVGFLVPLLAPQSTGTRPSRGRAAPSGPKNLAEATSRGHQVGHVSINL